MKKKTKPLLQKLKKFIGIPAGIIFLITLFLQAILQDHYFYYTRSPSPTDGRVVPDAMKGIVVYITKDQSEVLNSLFWICLISGVIALVVAVIIGDGSFERKK